MTIEELQEIIREEVLNELSPKVKLFKQKLLRRGIRIRYDKEKAQKDLDKKYSGNGQIISKKFGIRRGYWAVPGKGGQQPQSKPIVTLTPDEISVLTKTKELDRGRFKIVYKEATTSTSVPGYETPFAFDDEDDELNEAPYTSISWSNPEARVQVSTDIKKMSKILGKASHGVIKIMMDGVKAGRYDALDLSRGIEFGNVRDTHSGEREFIKVLWNKVRDGFRRYSKRRKLR